MLELRNVSKRFPAILAVDGVSFQANAGEITGYLGPNGPGKQVAQSRRLCDSAAFDVE